MARDRTSPPNRAAAPGLVPSHGEDRRLVERVLAGEAEALAALQARLGCVPRFVRMLNQRSGAVILDAAAVDDLAQDVLVTAWRKLDSFRGDASLETWVFRICDLLLRNATRKAANRRTAPLDAAAAVAAPGSYSISVDAEMLYVGLSELEPDAAQVLRLKHFDGLTFDEIGTSLGNSPNTIKTRYYRAMDSLRRWLRARTVDR